MNEPRRDDYIIDHSIFWIELLENGECIMDKHHDVADNQFYIIMPNRKAYVIKDIPNDGKVIVKRELTSNEYKIALKYSLKEPKEKWKKRYWRKFCKEDFLNEDGTSFKCN